MAAVSFLPRWAYRRRSSIRGTTSKRLRCIGPRPKGMLRWAKRNEIDARVLDAGWHALCISRTQKGTGGGGGDGRDLVCMTGEILVSTGKRRDILYLVQFKVYRSREDRLSLTNAYNT